MGNQLEQRFITMKAKYKKVSQDVEFLRHMNEGLETNKPALEREIQMVQRERQDAKDLVLKYLPALEEKVKMLMLQLETSMGGSGSGGGVGGNTNNKNSGGATKTSNAKKSHSSYDRKSSSIKRK